MFCLDNYTFWSTSFLIAIDVRFVVKQKGVLHCFALLTCTRIIFIRECCKSLSTSHHCMFLARGKIKDGSTDQNLESKIRESSRCFQAALRTYQNIRSGDRKTTRRKKYVSATKVFKISYF